MLLRVADILRCLIVRKGLTLHCSLLVSYVGDDLTLNLARCQKKHFGGCISVDVGVDANKSTWVDLGTSSRIGSVLLHTVDPPSNVTDMRNQHSRRILEKGMENGDHVKQIEATSGII